MIMFKTFLKLPLFHHCLRIIDAGRLVCASEAYFVKARNLGGGVYQCMYKTNPGNRGWRNFTVTFRWLSASVHF
jgi:hypothetical protein